MRHLIWLDVGTSITFVILFRKHITEESVKDTKALAVISQPHLLEGLEKSNVLCIVYFVWHMSQTNLLELAE